MSSLDQFRIISVSYINGKLWNIFYELDDGHTDFKTVKALDNQEAYHKVVKIITKKLSQK